MSINKNSQVRDVLSGVRFTGNKESTSLIFFKLIEEGDDCLKVVMSSGSVIILETGVVVVGVSNCCW